MDGSRSRHQSANVWFPSRTTSKRSHPSWVAAAWTARGRHKVMFGYSLNYLIDMEHAVIVDVEATPTRISIEVDATEAMIDRTEERRFLPRSQPKIYFPVMIHNHEV